MDVESKERNQCMLNDIATFSKKAVADFGGHYWGSVLISNKKCGHC